MQQLPPAFYAGGFLFSGLVPEYRIKDVSAVPRRREPRPMRFDPECAIVEAERTEGEMTMGKIKPPGRSARIAGTNCRLIKKGR